MRVSAARPLLLGAALACCASCTSRLEFQSKLELGAAGAAATPDLPGATLVEECDGPLDPELWRTAMVIGDSTFRSWGGRADWMADERVTVEDGLCVITADDEPKGDRAFTSGVMSTGGAFSQRFGRFEARIKAPVGTGLWPIFWLRDLQGWPPAINVVEMHGERPSTIEVALWYEQAGVRLAEGSELNQDYAAGFHVYSVDWSPTSLRYSVDGQAWFESAVGLDAIPGPLHVVINLSISDGSDPGFPPPDATTSWPAKLYVDWVHVFAPEP